ncbi:uncharacterized protein I206_106560 [Kwoniella pini CBS 10737]|uniref:Phosducin thioredoxin-like domain-containing protein n=1 Tax=Kwoniella pini CBS 10737 TaxID=1296096 RepID=A0A1B9HTU7_9TREE|nr:uncharacterized protein I206_07549 [Kwoniella pini CBS 10737]OCF46694.1 hypothetical protein I206_07549 [Kwoniella pini CBS 10737]
MPDSLETAALNGSLFTFDQNNPSSPTRSESSLSPLNTDDELGSDLSDNNSSNKIGKRGDISGKGVPKVYNEPIEHDGPQTGPKGVIEDRKSYQKNQRNEKSKELNDLILKQNKKAIIGLTIHEEDYLRKIEKQKKEEKEKEEEEEYNNELKELRKKRKEQLKLKLNLLNGKLENESDNEEFDDDDDEKIEKQIKKRGGLKEIGKENFIDSVEQIGWVIVLIYEPDIPRCTSLIASLLHLSLNFPSNVIIPVSLYKARATSLQFSLLPPTTTTTTIIEKYEDEIPLGKPDSDVLPTLLVYKDGELDKSFIRVDWDVDESGIEGLLRKEGILPSLYKTSLNKRNPFDDEDDENEH